MKRTEAIKVLFLDIDGVLNRDSTKERVEYCGAMFRGVDGKLLSMFLDWIAPRNISIVLSSSWRNDEHLVEHLEQVGLKFIGKTGRSRSRGLEIRMWLDAHPEVTHFAILDDISCGMFPVGGKLVQTSEKHGLRKKDLPRLDALLDLDGLV